jgi:hypothetical protein
VSPSKQERPEPILIENIRVRGEDAESTQLREELSDSTVERYVEALEQGDRFPAVYLVPAGDGTFWIADGWHRVLAHSTAGRRTIDAILIYVPPKADPLMVAKREALHANTKHGLPLSRGYQMKRARTALTMRCYRGWSLRELQREVGVHYSTISRVKKRMIEAGELPWCEEEPKLPPWWPVLYANLDKMHDPWEGDEELREATARLVQKLDAVDPRAWEFILHDPGDPKAPYGEHVVIHSGIVEGERWVIPVLDNEVVEGRPARWWPFEEPEEKGGGSNWSELSEEEREKIMENQRRRAYWQTVEKLKKHPHPKVRKAVKELAGLREVPGIWPQIEALAAAGGPLEERNREDLEEPFRDDDELDF